VLGEVVALYACTLLAIKALVMLQEAFRLPGDVLVLVPVLFLYVPVFWLRRQGLDQHDYALTLEGWRPALRFNLVIFLVLLPPFVIGNHLFQQVVFHRGPVGLWPKDFFFGVVVYQLLFVGIPEEFFYRGYMQSRLNEVFPRRFRLFGVSFGWGLLLTALLFTIGHSIVIVRWWHFSIVLPALVFGWIRERTGNVVASSLFHAGCNILMVTLDTYYGVIKP